MLKYFLYLVIAAIVIGLTIGGVHLYRVAQKNLLVRPWSFIIHYPVIRVILHKEYSKKPALIFMKLKQLKKLINILGST